MSIEKINTGDSTSVVVTRGAGSAESVDLHGTYTAVCLDANGRVKANELLHFLREHHNHTATDSELFHFVQYFDSDNDGVLSFQE